MKRSLYTVTLSKDIQYSVGDNTFRTLASISGEGAVPFSAYVKFKLDRLLNMLVSKDKLSLLRAEYINAYFNRLAMYDSNTDDKFEELEIDNDFTLDIMLYKIDQLLPVLNALELEIDLYDKVSVYDYSEDCVVTKSDVGSLLKYFFNNFSDEYIPLDRDEYLISSYGKMIYAPDGVLDMFKYRRDLTKNKEEFSAIGLVTSKRFIVGSPDETDRSYIDLISSVYEDPRSYDREPWSVKLSMMYLEMMDKYNKYLDGIRRDHM